MRRTNLFLDDDTVRELAAIRERFRLASNAAAVRFVVREYAALLAKQDAAARRRAEREAKETRA